MDIGLKGLTSLHGLEWRTAISEHYAQIRRKLGASLILVPAVAAIIRDETGRILFQNNHDGTWSLPAGAIEPKRESGASHRSGSPRGDRSQSQTGTNRRGEGFRYQYPNGHQVEYAVVLFECSRDSSAGKFDTDETKVLR
jgi:hypothetical protein